MSLLDAINAAAATLQGEKKSEPKAAPKAAKAAPKSEKPKAAPAPKAKSFLHLFNDYLRTCLRQALDELAAADPVFAKKMQAKGKSFDGCLNYIGEFYYNKAVRERNGRTCVSFGGNGDELVGLAAHYYDESEQSLKEELKKK